MKSYGWSETYVSEELTGAQGWVFFNWAVENESSVWGSSIERKGDGYIAQERNRLCQIKAKSQ